MADLSIILNTKRDVENEEEKNNLIKNFLHQEYYCDDILCASDYEDEDDEDIDDDFDEEDEDLFNEDDLIDEGYEEDFDFDEEEEEDEEDENFGRYN